VTEGQPDVNAVGALEAALLAIGDGDGDRAVGALLAHDRLVLADAEDEDPRRDGIAAAIGGDGARSAILLAVAAAHDAQRAQHLAVHGLWDRRAVGDQRDRCQGHRHQKDDADVLDAGLTAIEGSWEALCGHPGSLATTASRDNRAAATKVRRSCVSGGGTSGPR
jgi:hypothetical protein